jgi:hypothetical protein
VAPVAKRGRAAGSGTAAMLFSVKVRVPVRVMKTLPTFQGRPWTEPGIFGNFIIHMGPEGYKDCASNNPFIPFTNLPRIKCIFIHELTHVWQGFHHVNYVWNSLSHQCTAALNGVDPYAYTIGKNWSEYNVEQQGKIVEDWFDPSVANQSPNSSRFRYIRDTFGKA